MKAILLTRTGDPSVLDYVEVPTPQPKPGASISAAARPRRGSRPSPEAFSSIARAATAASLRRGTGRR
jgi:hypothetical protein